MPCKVERDGDTVRIICSRGNTPKCCVVCGKPADKLCDYPLDNDKTCDTPMCSKHAFKPRINGEYLYGADKDFCPEHAVQVVKNPPSSPLSGAERKE